MTKNCSTKQQEAKYWQTKYHNDSNNVNSHSTMSTGPEKDYDQIKIKEPDIKKKKNKVRNVEEETIKY